jgi:hypothetical protein
MEDETASFSEYFTSHARHAIGGSPAAKAAAQEVVIPLHDESLRLLSEIARAEGVTGSTEHMRSVALQICLDRFAGFCRENSVAVERELHLSAGLIKDRTLCLFSDTITELARLERELHCSETILIETAIRRCSEETGVGLVAAV